jgi:hypothetical protein
VTKLGPDARALIEASRGSLRPTAADRERILDALRTRIALGPVPPPQPSALPAAASRGLVGSATGLGVALVGGLVWLLARPPEPLPLVLAPALSIHQAVRAREVPVAPPPITVVPSALPLEPLSPKRAGSSLAEEVALLSRAETELHAGRFGSALKQLDDYERRFPKGALRQEDVAARVQALCGLGRVAEARRQLERLSPASPHAIRARAACGPGRLDE